MFVLLDLHMPGLCGRDVLEVLKRDPVLQAIPVIIFTSSAKESDLVACYQLGASGYLVKILIYRKMKQKADALVRRWLPVAELAHLSYCA